MGVYIKMKKRTLSLLLVLTLVMTALVGCGKKEEKPTEEEVVTEETTEETEAVEGEIAKIGLGKSTSLKGTEAGEKPASAQIDVTAAAVALDAEGKVVSVSIDTVQNKAELDADLKLVSETGVEVRTKQELKEEYDMKKASPIGKEWYEQMASLEEWMVGKTIDEIMAMPVKEKDENHKSVPDVEELTTSVTMTVEGYLAAVEDAVNNAVDVEGAAKVGLGVNSEISSGSTGLDGDKTPKIQANTTISAVAFDAEDKVVEAIIDTIQGVVEFDAEGKVTTNLEEEVKSKKELKDEYGMKKASAIEKEWYEQMEAFEEWMKGQTMEEISELPVVAKDEKHPSVPDVEELTSTVTISVESYLASAQKADVNKK